MDVPLRLIWTDCLRKKSPDTFTMALKPPSYPCHLQKEWCCLWSVSHTLLLRSSRDIQPSLSMRGTGFSKNSLLLKWISSSFDPSRFKRCFRTGGIWSRWPRCIFSLQLELALSLNVQCSQRPSLWFTHEPNVSWEPTNILFVRQSTWGNGKGQLLGSKNVLLLVLCWESSEPNWEDGLGRIR